MQLSTCEVSCVLHIYAMTTKIRHIINQSFGIVLAKFYLSRLKGLFFRGCFIKSHLAVKTGYNSATTRKILLEFQRREIAIQTNQN